MHDAATSRRLAPDPSALAGWRVAGEDLDTWLAGRGARPLAGRVPVLTFGSNRCPSKITWMRDHLGLAGPVVVLRARVSDVAAVWAAGRRARDGARPATLALAPGVVETHAVWMATPDQVAVLDACEGRGERYDLVRLHAGTVITHDGARIDDPWTYWPAAPAAACPEASRAPLLVDGAPVRCARVDQDRARDLEGEPGPVPGGVTTREDGTPDPETWPARVFAYGTLQPDATAWRLMARHVRHRPGTGPCATPAWMPGRVYDTGRGYPALRPAAPASGASALGTVLELCSPASALPSLDAYEGPEYRRIRSVTYWVGRERAIGPVTGSVCWVWVWADPAADRSGWPTMTARWGAARG